MKRLFSVLTVLFMSFMLFAEPASVGLTDSDVLNYIKNYSTIQKTVNSRTTEAQLKDILLKNGISGDNRIQKFTVLGQGTALVAAEAEMDEETMAMLDALGSNPIKNIAAQINSKDLAVIRKYSKQLLACANNEDAAEVNSTARKNPSMINGTEREKLLAQQEEAVRQQQLEEERIKESKKKKPLEGSKYLSTVSKKIKASKKTGDCGFLYQKYDSKNASYYKKSTAKPPVISADKTWYTNANQSETEAFISVSSSSITLRYINNDGEEVSEEIKITATSVDFYYPQKTGKEKYYDKGIGGELVFKSKETGTVHIWYNDFKDSKNQKIKVWIEALGEVDFSSLASYGG